eukprot:6210154-Pleurochrysis_carterae.AAC.1
MHRDSAAQRASYRNARRDHQQNKAGRGYWAMGAAPGTAPNRLGLTGPGRAGTRVRRPERIGWE